MIILAVTKNIVAGIETDDVVSILNLDINNILEIKEDLEDNNTIIVFINGNVIKMQMLFIEFFKLFSSNNPVIISDVERIKSISKEYDNLIKL